MLSSYLPPHRSRNANIIAESDAQRKRQGQKTLKFVAFINIILIVIIDKNIFLWYTASIVLEREG